MKFSAKILATLTTLLIAGASSSHVVLEDAAAASGASYRATFKVGHGCDGSATTGIKVQIPEGF